MLFAGGSFVLMPGYEPRAYLEALAKYKCTYSRGVAAVFTMVLQHREYLSSLDLSALRSMTIGSAVVAPELLDAVERALPHVKVSESYGLTEGGSPLRPPIDGRPVPRGSPGVPAPEIDRRQRGGGRRIVDPLSLRLSRLLQRTRNHARETHGRVAAHRRHL